MAVRIKVIEVRGDCSAGHEVGQQWFLEDETVGGICFSGFCSLLPWIHMLRFGAETPWPVEVGCPDHENCVVFSIATVQ